MSKITFDAVGQRFYETGVRECVLYRHGTGEDSQYSVGVPWNGIVSITESRSGAEPNDLYADDIKYLSLISIEKFDGTIEAYYSPEEFDECDGYAEAAEGVTLGQQSRAPFGLAYKTVLGNDTDKNDHGYKLHLIYDALAQPSEKPYSTINESPEALTFSWSFSTTPVAVTGHKHTSIITINSTKVDATKLAALEAILYGDENSDPRLPLPDEVIGMFKTT